ncbi:MAG: hypothetical protein ACP5PV_13205 [Methanothrix sp.]
MPVIELVKLFGPLLNGRGIFWQSLTGDRKVVAALVKLNAALLPACLREGRCAKGNKS